MKENKCLNCGEYKRCRESYVSWIFFVIGIIATIAIRIVTVLIHFEPAYGKIAWYIGVGGFFLFFLYKFRINTGRVRIIEQNDLMDKIGERRRLSKDDYRIIDGILCALSSKKERINFFFIFWLSAVALLIALYIDFIK